MTRLQVYDGTQSYPTRSDLLDYAFVPPGSVGTTTAITSIPTSVNNGASFTISGTIKTAAGVNIASGHGTMKIQSLVAGVWTDLYTNISITTGTWSKTGATLTANATVRAVYVPPQRTISSRSATGGIATINTSVTHPYVANEWITHSGFTAGDVSFNGYYQILTVPNSSAYTFALGGSFGAGAPSGSAVVVCAHVASQSTSYSITCLQLQSFTLTYDCTDTKVYNGTGSMITNGAIGQGAVLGADATTYGNRRSVIIFPASIATDLAAANAVTNVEVFLQQNASGSKTMNIGDHNYSSAPASGPTGNTALTAATWSTPGGKWISLASAMYSRFKAGTAKGIILGPAATYPALNFATFVDGFGNDNPPQLRITYNKWV